MWWRKSCKQDYRAVALTCSVCSAATASCNQRRTSRIGSSEAFACCVVRDANLCIRRAPSLRGSTPAASPAWEPQSTRETATRLRSRCETTAVCTARPPPCDRAYARAMRPLRSETLRYDAASKQASQPASQPASQRASSCLPKHATPRTRPAGTRERGYGTGARLFRIL